MSNDYDIRIASNILKILNNNPYSKLTANEIKEKLDTLYKYIKLSDLIKILDGLFAAKLIQEHFSTNLLDPESKSKIEYSITDEGKNRYNDMKQEAENATRARAYNEYDEEEKARKRSNRRWLIFCSIGFVLAIAVIIIVSLSLG